VLNLEALVTCWSESRVLPPPDEWQGCLDFLQSLTEENVILLGVMADTAEECMILTRIHG
jgi:hypothetical protein